MKTFILENFPSPLLPYCSSSYPFSVTKRMVLVTIVRRIAITKIKSRVARVRVASTKYARIFNTGRGMGWPQKEYLTRCGVARRRAYPSIFIRRRLHGYISRNVTITNTPVHRQRRRLPVSGGVGRRILEPCRPPFALRHCLYPIFQPRKTKRTGEYVSRICVSRVLAGFVLAIGAFRCHRGVIEHR